MSWSPPAWGCRLTQAACRGIGVQGPLKPTSRAPLERGPETKTVLTSQPGAWCPLESWEERTSEDLTQGQELQEAPPRLLPALRLPQLQVRGTHTSHVLIFCC